MYGGKLKLLTYLTYYLQNKCSVLVIVIEFVIVTAVNFLKSIAVVIVITFKYINHYLKFDSKI